jgi:hypothetical protein
LELHPELLSEIQLVLQGPLTDLLVRADPPPAPGPPPRAPMYSLFHRLKAEQRSLGDALNGLNTNPTLAGLNAAVETLDVRGVDDLAATHLLTRIKSFQVDPHSQDAPALAILVQRASAVFEALFSGHFQDLIDFDAVRNQIQQALVDVFLPKIALTYAFDTSVNPLPPFFEMMKPADRQEYGGQTADPDLALRFNLTIDMRHSGARHMTSSGRLQPFTVDLFQVITLYFRPATFSSEDGRQPDVSIKVAKAELGEAVAFISELASYLSPAGGSGFFIDLSPEGVEAGFAIDLGTISIGEVSFTNISLGASVELPFDNRPALFKFNFARRDAPFLIFATPFGGGGFLSIISDSRSVVGFEAAFEYGGGGAFAVGPLTGQGRIMTGLYISRSASSVSLSGYFVAAGSAHIACFGISACLLVGIEQQPGGNVVGSATYTFSFSLGIAHVDFQVGVHRTIAKGWGGGNSDAQHGMIDSRQAATLALAPGPTPPLECRSAIQPDFYVVADTKAMNEDWATYQTYFDEAL